jgi:hypothetical protein
MRQADRLLRDLRQSLRPLQARSTFVWWARLPAELPAIVGCVFWVRVLAISSETRLSDRELAPILARVRFAADRLDGFAHPDAMRSVVPAAEARLPREIGVTHVGQMGAALLQTTLDNVESVLDLMADRFGTDGWSALVSRSPL